MKQKPVFLIVFLLFACFSNAQNQVNISNDFLSVSVAKMGAELQSIQSSSGTEFLWQGDSAFWGSRSPVMFPVNVRFKDERYTYKGVPYEMPRMGLAKTAAFRIVEQEKNKVVLAFESNENTLNYYPFQFYFEATYSLKGDRLNNSFTIKNTGKETMYFALGGHPGFRFPFENERSRNQYTFSEKLILERTEISNSLVQPNTILWLINENVLNLGDARIPNAGMFVKDIPSREIGVGDIENSAFVTVNLGDFPNVNLWSPPGMPFACIEPMVGHHDFADSPLAIEEKTYLVALPAGQEKQYAFSIQIHEQVTTTVNSLTELKSKVENAKPGDVIVLEDGILEGEPITIRGKGTMNRPIRIRANEKSKTILKSPLKLEGEYLVLQGLKITDKGALEISGKGCRICACTWSDAKSGKWLRVLPGSSEIEIDHNTFENKTSNRDFDRGCQLMQIVVRNENECHHIHHNYFKDILKGKTGNGFETLQLITENNPFDPPPGDCNSVIENNLFERCNGEAEIISIKSNGNYIKRNTFLDCRGSMVLRHGDNNYVTRNYFDGKNEPGSGGIRIQGTDQKLVSNYFINLGQFGVGMMDGTPDDLYIRVERARLVYNSFINCNNPLIIGLNHSKHPNGTPPKDCGVGGNLFYFDPPNKETKIVNLVQNDEPENWIWLDNIAFGAPVGENIPGLKVTDPHLQLKDNGWYFPTVKTPVCLFPRFRKKAIGEAILDDSNKRMRAVGAVFYPIEKSGFDPIDREEVGVGSFNQDEIGF